MRRSTLSRQKVSEAFSLIELMVVVVILGILAAGVVQKVSGSSDDARVARAQSDVALLASSLEQFYLHMERYPTSEEGLQALRAAPEDDEEGKWKGPYLAKLANDPWKHPYVYISPGDVNVESYDLLSYGADGEEGGEGYDADIKHWTDEEDLEEGAPQYSV